MAALSNKRKTAADADMRAADRLVGHIVAGWRCQAKAISFVPASWVR